ncbi:MAG: Aminotransferase class V-fold PLP-dependent enzyme [Thermoleophilia bacterium]|nr:Aminotransferase class V-fold PLP-dependent enzyme [Thermoleophilia bacterium]
MRDGFLLDPDVVYLNHGGYGACPVAVFDEYQRWQRELERQPTDFFARRLSTWFWEGRTGSSLLDDARASLAAFVGARAEDLVFVPNATYGLNAVLRSLRIRPEEEILTTKHEYGAVERTLSFIRANIVHCEPDELVASIGVRTRAILVSHVTSPTALVIPVEEICAVARKAGVLSIVDGAHAPGQIPLDLETVGADIYAGNCHKWLCAPKGSGFLWARPEHQEWIEPLVISWGYHDEADFGERHGWQGTNDPAAYLAVPKAIEMHAGFDLEAAAALADEAERRLSTLRLKTMSGVPAPFMRAVQLPPVDPFVLWRRLYEEHRVEAPVYERDGRRLLRVSIGPYNDESDIDRLISALRDLL